MLGLLAIIVAIGCIACGGSSSPQSSSSIAPVPSTAQQRSDWLGLNYNSSAHVGAVDEFSRAGIVWDRAGPLEIGAGDTPGNKPTLKSGLHTAFAAGMIPDVVVDPLEGPHGCTSNPDTTNLCVPISHFQVNAYVTGFVRTVAAIRSAYPSRHIVYEPMDEPWNWAAPAGSLSSQTGAQQYAAVLALLLPAARSAGIPLSSIYVPATGTLEDGSQWVTDLYHAQPCLARGTHTCGPIEGWNVHIYGPPTSTTTGVPLLTALRPLMRSGSDNVIASELGFCATDIADDLCDTNTTTVDGPSTQAALWLTQALRQARAMHAAGWLKAVILWDRSGGGWSMQLPDGSLTAQGRALVAFARKQNA